MGKAARKKRLISALRGVVSISLDAIYEARKRA